MKKMIYKDFALVYDPIMSNYYASMWWKNFERIRKKYRLNYKTVADIGCGTGQIAEKMAKQGKQVFLIDQSIEMLEVAKQRCPDMPIMQQDMTKFDCSLELDLVISVHGTLHYLKNKSELNLFFKQVYKQLKPGGIFCFDQFTKKHLKKYFGGGQEIFEGEEYVSIWHHRWLEQKQQSEIIIDIFSKQGDYWQRFLPERHIQKAFLWQEIKQTLKQVGFKKIVAYQLPTGRRAASNDEKRMIIAIV